MTDTLAEIRARLRKVLNAWADRYECHGMPLPTMPMASFELKLVLDGLDAAEARVAQMEDALRTIIDTAERNHLVVSQDACSAAERMECKIEFDRLKFARAALEARHDE